MTTTMTVMQPLMSNNMWTSETFDCFDDMDICTNQGCYGFWCYPCLSSETLEDFNENEWLCCFDFGALSPVHLALRYGVRKQYGIQGSLCGDCCTVFWCGVCSMCQVAREIQHRKMQQKATVINTQPVQTPWPIKSCSDMYAACRFLKFVLSH